MISNVNLDKAYSIHYSIKNHDGEILEASATNEPLTFYVGDETVLKVIEQAVVNAADNKKLNLTLKSEDAFGIYDASLTFKVKRRAFESNEPLKLNQSIYANTPKGKKLVTITNITSNTVTVDANHKLAGKILYVEVQIM